MIWKSRYKAISFLVIAPVGFGIGLAIGINPFLVIIALALMVGLAVRIINFLKIAIIGRPLLYDHKTFVIDK